MRIIAHSSGKIPELYVTLMFLCNEGLEDTERASILTAGVCSVRKNEDSKPKSRKNLLNEPKYESTATFLWQCDRKYQDSSTHSGSDSLKANSAYGANQNHD